MNTSDRVPHALIQAEHLRTLFNQFPTTTIAQITIGTVLAFMIWDSAPHNALLAWLITMYGLTIVRWLMIHSYRRHSPNPEATRQWARMTVFLSGCFGLIWAVAAILFLDSGQPVNLIMITVILVGVSSGAVVALSSYRPAYMAFVLPGMLSLIATLFLRGGEVGEAIAFLALLSLVANVFYSSNIYRVLDDSLRLRFENIALRQETEEKSALLETTLYNMRQGISMVDRDGRLRMWNQQFLDLLGLSHQQVDDSQNLDTILSAANPPLPELAEERIEYRRPDDTVIEILQNVTPDGGRVLTYTDISDLKRREQALEAARQTAERANAAKTRFLAAASHDLRQPIHALGLFFANLADRVRSSETELLIRQIEDAIEAIDSMLNALLDISKLDAGIVHPNIGSVAIANLFKRLESEYQPLALETGNRLRMRSCRAVVRSDAAMLERMLRNLISNALRYTKNGRVLAAARCRADKLRIEVYDTGCGIPEDQLEDIFLEFHQLSNPERDRRQGLGLGLAIVRRLAALLEHAVEVRSRLGKGSCFAITVPLAQDSSSCSSPVTTLIPGKELQGRRLLILDDDGAVLEAMGGLLERWGCTVIKAASLEEAQQKLALEAHIPDLLIVDYRLRDGVSGLAAVAMLRETLHCELPVLVITGDTAPDRLREAQASGYPLLHKPVQPAKLRSAVRQLTDSYWQKLM